MPRRKGSSPRVSDVVRAVDRIAPFKLAESWDNVGLQFGHPDSAAGRILVGLEVTKDLLKEAKKRRAGMLVTHHPLLFRPPKSFSEDQVVPSLAAELIRNRLALVAAHTNVDSVGYGTNGVLADLLGLQGAERRFLVPVPAEARHVKYAVFVPATHVDRVIEVIARSGAGVIGNYSHCTFRTPGMGTYRPLEGANPYSGKVGELEQAEEVRLECVCPREKLAALVNAVRAVHPYEEVAYDVLPLMNDAPPHAGLGIIGNLKAPTTIGKLVACAKKGLGIRSVGLVGDPQQKVTRVAICTGAGGSIVRGWRRGTADILVTGEMTHHECADAYHLGLPVLLAGHWASEVVAGPRIAELLKMALAEAGFADADVVVAADERNPLQRL